VGKSQAIYFGALFVGNLLANRFFSASKMKAEKKKRRIFGDQIRRGLM
jgi:uncharacterized membrane protein YsdA (DUF1294 family)